MQRNFYATADDLLPVFALVEEKLELAYTKTGLFESKKYNSVHEGKNLPTIRLPAPGPNATSGYNYLVTFVDTPINIREVPQNKGGKLYAIDQLENPDSITFMHGGLFEEQVLLSGVVGTCTDSKLSKKLFNAFSKAIGKYFTRIQSYYIGPKAIELMSGGTRLTIGANSPSEYDLAYE